MKIGVADYMCHAGGCVARGVQRPACAGANLIAVAVLQQHVELNPVAGKLCNFVEDFAKGILRRHDRITDIPQKCRCFQNVCAFKTRPPGGTIDVHNTIDTRAGRAIETAYHVGNRAAAASVSTGDALNAPA